MSDESNRSFSLPQIPWASLAPIVTVLTSLVLLSWESLDSLRPPAPGVAQELTAGSQRIGARLWQDPVSVVMATAKEMRERPVKADATEILSAKQKATASTPLGVTIMPVVMLGGSYGQDVEFRGRTRHAVMAALWTSGYAPEDGDRVGAFFQPSAEPGLEPGTDAIVAFEWCRSISKGSDRVLLLWVSETVVGERPLRWLNELVGSCRSVIGSSTEDRTRLLLAGGSTSVQKLVEEAMDPGGAPDLPNLKDARIISCTATADDTALERNVKQKAGGQQGVATDLMERITARLNNGIRVTRCLATDGDMMERLVDELKARRITLPGAEGGTCDPPRVVFVSEFDSVYGRNLPLAFARAAGVKGDAAIPSLNGLAKAAKDWLDIHIFARGFDGRLQGDAGGRSSDADKKKDATANSLTPPAEATEGLNQSDYLRRLALEIELEDSRERAAGRQGVRAVGIVGSDVYDKLMILKALRPRLPEAIFFTTDLDARLAQPKDWTFTRNLLIATPYGFSPGTHHAESGKLGIAPFRDSYQTSTFHGATQLLDAVAPGAGNRPAVQLYEVGRSGPVPLDVERSDTNYSGMEKSQSAVVRYIQRSYLGMIWAVFISFVVCLAWMLRTGAVKQVQMPLWKKTWCSVWHDSWMWFLVSCVVSFAVTVVLWWWQSGHSHPEPLAFAEGVSIWPTVGLRLLGILMGAHFLAKARRELAQNARRLTRVFFGKKATLMPPVRWPFAWQGGVWDTACHAFRELHRFFVWDVKAPFTTDATGARKGPVRNTDPVNLWTEYWHATHRRARFWRVIVMFLFYFIGSGFLFLWLGRPKAPARGDFAGIVEGVTLFGWVFIQMIVTFAVIDALLQMSAFVHQVNLGKSAWPPTTLATQREPALLHEDYCELLDIRLIAERTKVVGRLFLYPFIIQAAGIFARMPFIDNWTWPLSLILVMGLNIGIVVVSILVLRGEVELARSDSLSRLGRNVPQADDKRRKALEGAIAQIRSTTEGAFAPITQQPAVRWVLWLISGVSAGGILQHFKGIW